MDSVQRVPKINLAILLVFLAFTGRAFAGDLSGSLYLDNMQFSSGPVVSDPTPSNLEMAPVLIPEASPSYSRSNLTLKAFPKHLGQNLTGLFSTSNLAPLLGGLALTGISTQYDHRVGNYFEGGNMDTLYSESGTQLGRPYVLAPVVGSLFLAGLKSDNDRFKAFSYALAQGYVLNTGVVWGLKTATSRTRPDGSNAQSFPSGHSADSFMIATVIDEFYGHKAGILAYGVAGVVASSRLKSNKHWLSDVAAGATIGYIIGKTVSRNIGGLQLYKNIKMQPAINPFNKEYGVNFSIPLP